MGFLAREWQALLSALSFFSRFPVVPKTFDLTRGVLYLPLVGVLLGGVSVLFLKAGEALPPSLAAFGVLGITYFLADYFHFDGLLDMVDALAAGGDREYRLKVLKSPEVGALGVLFAFFFLLGEFLVAQELLVHGRKDVFFFRPLCGRQALGLLALLGRTAKEGGLGRLFLDVSRKRLWIIQFFWLPLFIYAPLPTLGTILLVFFLRHKFEKSFGGLTGDLLGATLMLAQWLFMALAFLVGAKFSSW